MKPSASHNNFKFRLADIKNEIINIENFITGYDFKKFSQDQKTIHAVIRAIEVIGEAANSLPEEFTSQHAIIPWRAIVDMRNNLIHEYFGVDINIIWRTITTDIPDLKELLDAL